MNRPLGRLGAAATLGQHCPQMTQRRCTLCTPRICQIIWHHCPLPPMLPVFGICIIPLSLPLLHASLPSLSSYLAYYWIGQSKHDWFLCLSAFHRRMMEWWNNTVKHEFSFKQEPMKSKHLDWWQHNIYKMLRKILSAKSLSKSYFTPTAYEGSAFPWVGTSWIETPLCVFSDRFVDLDENWKHLSNK